LAQVVAGTPSAVPVAPVAALYCCTSNPQPADCRANLLDVDPCRPKPLYLLGIRWVVVARRCYSAPEVAS
jgi:hypothetical protein